MVGRAFRAFVAALVGAVLVGAPAVAGDPPDGGQPPRTSGPLVGLGLPCERGETAGKGEYSARMCTWTYHLLPAETNALEDFSVLWFQTEVDPGGQCVSYVSLEIQVPKGDRVVSAAPSEGGRFTRSSAPDVTELTVDADGAAPVPGTVTQDSAAPAGRIKVELGKSRYRYTWRGTSRSTVMVPMGVQIAHSAVPNPSSEGWGIRGAIGWRLCSEPFFIEAHRGRGEIQPTHRQRVRL